MASSVELLDFKPISQGLERIELHFLKDIPARDVANILGGAVWEVELPERRDLFQQGDPVRYLYVLVEGRVHQLRRVNMPAGRTIIRLRRELGQNALLGVYDLLYRQPHSVRTRALEPCRIVAIDARAITRLLYRFPHLRDTIAPMPRVNRLRTMPFFHELDWTVTSFVADTCTETSFKKGAMLYDRGVQADTVYFIDQGQVRLTFDGGERLWLANGAVCGVLNFGPRRVEQRVTDHYAEAMWDTRVFSLPFRRLVDITALNPDRSEWNARVARWNTINSMPLLRGLTEEERIKLLGFMSHIRIPNHPHMLLQQGEIGDSLWVLMPGSRARIYSLNAQGQAIPSAPVEGPNYFSDAALVGQRALEATISAEPESEWMRLHWQDFRAFVQETGDEINERLNLTVSREDVLGQDEARQRYEWLQLGEQLITFRRRHWIALVRKLLWPVALTPLLFLIWFGLDWALDLTLWSTFLVMLLPCLGLVGFYLWSIIDYFNDYFLVTNTRIVRQEKVVLINELRQVAFLRQIQNIDTDVSFFGNLLGYGDLVIRMSGGAGSIRFDYVTDPNDLRDTIFRARNRSRMFYQAEGKKEIQNLLEERLGLVLKMPSRVRPVAAGTRVGVRLDSFLRRLWQRLSSEPIHDWSSEQTVVWRKHWIILLGRLIGPLAIVTTALVVTLLLEFPFLARFGVTGEGFPVLIVPFVIIGLVALGWAGWIIADWRNDTYQIDGTSVADVEKKPLFFAEQRRTARLEDIENVQFTIPSPLHYLLDFGDVLLQTAAVDGRFTFDNVPQPRAVSEEIRRRIEDFYREEERKRARARAEELPDWFETYNRLGAEQGSG